MGHFRLERLFHHALLLIPFDGEPFTLDAGTVISLLVEVMLLSVLLFQDRLNGMIACKNTLAGTKEYHVVFGEESYPLLRRSPPPHSAMS